MAIDAFIVMSNHVHGLLFIVGAPLVGAHALKTHPAKDRVNPDKDRAGTRPAPTSSLGILLECLNQFQHQ